VRNSYLTTPLIRGIAVWFLIMFAETLHGILRRLFVEPLIGDLTARQVGVLVGSLIILLITYFTVRWLRASRTVHFFAIGAIWIILTFCFEAGLGRATGASWNRILADYDLTAGGLMLFGLLVMFLSPYLMARVRKI
jgi:hypothetical protein